MSAEHLLQRHEPFAGVLRIIPLAVDNQLALQRSEAKATILQYWKRGKNLAKAFPKLYRWASSCCNSEMKRLKNLQRANKIPEHLSVHDEEGDR
jgi:hypothetical protein